MGVSDPKKFNALEAESAGLKKRLAETVLEKEVIQEALRKIW